MCVFFLNLACGWLVGRRLLSTEQQLWARCYGFSAGFVECAEEPCDAYEVVQTQQGFRCTVKAPSLLYKWVSTPPPQLHGTHFQETQQEADSFPYLLQCLITNDQFSVLCPRISKDWLWINFIIPNVSPSLLILPLKYLLNVPLVSFFTERPAPCCIFCGLLQVACLLGCPYAWLLSSQSVLPIEGGTIFLKGKCDYYPCLNLPTSFHWRWNSVPLEWWNLECDLASLAFFSHNSYHSFSGFALKPSSFSSVPEMYFVPSCPRALAYAVSFALQSLFLT